MITEFDGERIGAYLQLPGFTRLCVGYGGIAAQDAIKHGGNMEDVPFAEVYLWTEDEDGEPLDGDYIQSREIAGTLAEFLIGYASDYFPAKLAVACKAKEWGA